MGNPLALVSEKVRLTFYAVYALVGVVIGATQAGVSAAVDMGIAVEGTTFVVVLAIVKEVWLYLGIALGLTAATHINKKPDDIAVFRNDGSITVASTAADPVQTRRARRESTDEMGG